MMSWGKKAPAHVERVWDLAAGPTLERRGCPGAGHPARRRGRPSWTPTRSPSPRPKPAASFVLIATAPDDFDAWEWLDEELHACFGGTSLVKDLTCAARR